MPPSGIGRRGSPIFGLPNTISIRSIRVAAFVVSLAVSDGLFALFPTGDAGVCRHVSLCLSTRLRTGRPLAGCSAMPVLQFIQCNRRPQRRCDRSGDRAALFDTRTGRRAMRPMRLRISRVDRDRPFLSAIGAQSPAIVRVKMPLSLHVAPPVMERLVRSVLGRCTRHLEPLRAMKTIPARHPSMVATRLTRGIWERNAQDAPSERRSARKDRTCPPLVFES